ncbi:hypothetical protein BJ875DRAFT_84625 [Amylocarpus encephaloides]|uniref:RING-type domain-containing protein n=1 Tax=Amylocarpus encephaloides TaxID=45428 RepID=A0A9P7YTR2_9HELO|nr:hypothetical protein BJ875DRAFT_84625 [Amylocarpus encephaloides]
MADERSRPASAQPCAICYRDLDDDAFQTSPCEHRFCRGCWVSWETLQRSQGRGLTCPSCRTVVTNTALTAPVPAEETVTCQTCSNDVIVELAAQTVGCGHIHCTVCLVSYFEDCVFPGSPLRCPSCQERGGTMFYMPGHPEELCQFERLPRGFQSVL